MSNSPFAHASSVSNVHGNGLRYVASSDRYAVPSNQSNVICAAEGPDQRQTQIFATTTVPQTHATFDSEPQSKDGEDQGAYTKLVKSPMLPFMTMGVPTHVFKVRETTKLLLFMGVAIGGILLLDLSARLLVSIAHSKCEKKV
jgi:hypothetical protein